MPNSSAVTSRLDDDVHDRLETYAAKRDISKSQALAELTENGLNLIGDGHELSLDTTTDLQRMAELQSELNQQAEQLTQKLTAQQTRLEDKLTNHIDLSDVDNDAIKAFAEKPYNILPKGENEYYVTTPKFVPFHVGHLLKQDDAWNTYVVNKYVSWIEEIPDEISDKISIDKKYEHATVDQNTGILELGSESEREQAWDDLGGRDGGLHKRVDDTKIQLQRGEEFTVISELVENGNLPFKPNGPKQDEIRSEPRDISLREYQQRAWSEFTEHGHVGVYWPPGLGKTFFALYAGDRLQGEKLVVVPSTVLEEQWKERIEAVCRDPSEWTVKTYQYLTYQDNIEEFDGENAPTLTVFDEAHTLPSNTYSTLSTLNTDFRIGLSATPYREDDRTDYIFALTGRPIGVQWEEIKQYTDFTYPNVSVYLYKTQHEKAQDLHDLYNDGGKTLIFCDSIDAGNKVSEELGIPFVHGETPKQNRMEMFRENTTVIASRVADEGMSLDELDRVIEFDFHGGSRRQELQRAGRIMHTDGVGEHIIQMTDEEYESHGKRLYSLEEKGIDIEFIRRS